MIWTRWPKVLSWVVMACSTALTLGAQLDSAGPDQEKKITATRIGQPLVIDGFLDEPQWELAQPISDFLQQDPDTGEAGSEATEVKILYDDQFLYIGVRCFDSQGAEGVVVNDMTRDYTPFDTDVFAVVLDTFNDDRNGMLFSTNPAGAKHDSQFGNDGRKVNVDWDTIWHAGSQITDAGWQAEMAIPFKSLRFQSAESQTWGINFLRRMRRKNEVVHWALIPRPYFINRVSWAGRLEGLERVRPGRSLYVKPYVSLPVVRRRQDDVDFVPDAGLDVKYAVGSQMTLDLTVNTDFSQVEADDQQINLTRFSLFFPEKREFFLENANIFQFGPGTGGGFFGAFRDVIPFFSRRIGISGGGLVPILGGARFTGLAGDYGLGFLSLQVDDFEEASSTNFSVARVRRNILRNSDIGGIFINKQEMGGDFNRTYGVDANLTFRRFLDISSFLMKTSTPEISDQQFSGLFRIGWQDPFLSLAGSYLSIQENFDPEVGFVPRSGIRKTTGRLAIRPRPGERIPSIRQLEPSVNLDYITDQDNLLETRTLDARFQASFHNGSLIWVGARSRFERLTEPFAIRPGQSIAGGGYDFNEFILVVGSDQSRMFSGSGEVTTGTFFDGDKDTYRATGKFQTPQFRAQVSWRHDNIDLPSGVFATDLVTTRLDYAFNPRMFLNTLIQYNSDLQEISSNIRFNLIHRPLSDLFLVYNERRTSTGEVTERALIAKLTYMFSF